MSITIKHLEGPLAGTEQHFDDKVNKIEFGREADCQVIYPPECTIVGKRHFLLERQKSGDYRVDLEGQRFVSVDGVPAENKTVVRSGSVLRLGSATDGPSFKVEIEKAKAALPDTEKQDKVKTWREMLADTRRLGAAGLGTLAALLSAAVIYFMIQADLLESQIKTAKAEAVELASKSFSKAVLSEAAAAVHLVVKKDGKKLIPMATAWTFAPDKLGTNAHVTEALDGLELSYAIVVLPFEAGKDAVIIEIKDVVTHPGYGSSSSIGTSWAPPGAASSPPSTSSANTMSASSRSTQRRRFPSIPRPASPPCSSLRRTMSCARSRQARPSR